MHGAGLIDKGIFTAGADIDVIFASNDYHLKRIFEIQSLMDEQGLLRVLKQRCAEHGLNLHIDSSSVTIFLRLILTAAIELLCFC